MLAWWPGMFKIQRKIGSKPDIVWLDYLSLLPHNGPPLCDHTSGGFGTQLNGGVQPS